MELHRIQSSEDKMFAPVTALYESSFIPVERREYADHLLALSDSNFFMTAVTENSVSVGLMFYRESPEFIYLEHLAIMPDVREKGYGGKAVEQLKMLGKTVILEIEPPENGSTETKRRRFYENHGFVYNPFNHLQLHYRANDPDCFLKIMSYPSALDDNAYDKFRGFLDCTVLHE